MRVGEFLVELADSPAEFSTGCDDDVCELLAPDIGLSLYLTRGLSKNLENEIVYVEFAVRGEYGLTGGGNAVKILSTVMAMLRQELPRFIVKTDRYVSFGAEKSEPSRVKLYRRAVPLISSILGSGWKFEPESSGGSLETYTWVRAR